MQNVARIGQREPDISANWICGVLRCIRQQLDPLWAVELHEALPRVISSVLITRLLICRLWREESSFLSSSRGGAIRETDWQPSECPRRR
jgi:hypothetical protein